MAGCSRSGTTWLDRMLRRFQGVHSAGEGGLGERVRELVSGRGREAGPFQLMPRRRARLMIDKTPSNAYDLEALAHVSNARIVHMVRDPRAVVASMLDAARHWARARAGFSASDAAHLWVRAVDEVHRARRWWGDYLIELRFEDLRLDTETHLKRAANHLGLSPSRQELRRAAEAEALVRDSVPQGRFVRAGLIDGWRGELSRPEIEVVELAVGARLERYGYTRYGR
ncbi:MAG: sulfotransferase [Sandaracinus sp.]|nr:sulfotransferase [Myxococcales bacterium]MCB9615573.1 sulfotransferase [Sandaracinus sp.]MCB9637097.1 sulfotransferase [Sandaracinus sp.]